MGNPKSGGEDDITAQMRALVEQIAELEKGLEGKPISDEDRTKIEELRRVPHDPRWRELDPTYVPPEGPVSTDEPGPGRDLSERDLTGRDLSGMDLRGANLEDAILTRANLTGCDLRGANLRRAILFRADLTGADLTGCDLSRANAARVSAPFAVLRGATPPFVRKVRGQLRSYCRRRPIHSAAMRRAYHAARSTEESETC